MRNVRTWCLAAAFALALFAVQTNASEGFDDVAKLAKSGITEDVLVAFVQASPIPYELTVDEILFLNDLGVTSKSIQEILNHGKDIRAGKEPVVTAVADNNATLPQTDDQLAVPVSLDTLGAANPNERAADQNADANSGYVSPLTGAVSYTPEPIHEQEIVRETVYTPTPVVACQECTTSHFYEALTPYGTWVSIDGTWCWQPSVGSVDRGWRPYANRGHWVWSDAGWCWESDYSWGWAPFHYGRWWQAPGYGWMWTPDTVWGPSWVNWRQSDSHWGWAPLPPAARFETNAAVGVGFHFGGKHWGVDAGVGLDFGLTERDYCFVPQEHFCDHNLNTVFIPREEQVAIYNRTTIIQNNITINKTTNNVFVNGPSSKLVEQRTNRPLRQMRIADNEVQAGQTLGKTTVEDRENGVLHLYRPHVSQVATESPAEVAARQVARQQANTRPSADARVLAASARADELRERHFATQDAKRQEVLTRQSAQIEEVAARRSDNEQKRLNTLMATTDNAEQKAAFAAKIAAERQRAEEARLQKVALEQQAAEQRKHTQQLAIEQNRVARAAASATAARSAEETKASLIAERAAREKANKDAALLSQKAAADQRARNAEVKATGKNDAEARALAAEADHKAKLEADRAARESSRQTQADLLARQKAQIEADRAARAKVSAEKPVNTQPATKLNSTETAAERAAADRAAREAAVKAANDRTAAERTPRETVRVPNTNTPANPATPPNPLVDKNAERAAAHEAALEAQRQKAEANRAAAEKAAAERAAERNALKSERTQPRTNAPAAPNQPQANWPVNPRTGQQYDPNNPNDPNAPTAPRKR